MIVCEFWSRVRKAIVASSCSPLDHLPWASQPPYWEDTQASSVPNNEELRTPTNQPYESPKLEVHPPAPVKPSNENNSGWHCDCSFMCDPEAEAPGWSFLIYWPIEIMWNNPTPVLLPRKSCGRRSLVGCSPWGC